MSYYANEYQNPFTEPVITADSCGKCLGETNKHTCGQIEGIINCTKCDYLLDTDDPRNSTECWNCGARFYN